MNVNEMANTAFVKEILGAIGCALLNLGSDADLRINRIIRELSKKSRVFLTIIAMKLID